MFTVDIYVWIPPDRVAEVLPRFVENHVDEASRSHPPLVALLRTYVTHDATPEHARDLEEKRIWPDRPALSLYLDATAVHGAIIALTDEHAVVLGLCIEDILDYSDEVAGARKEHEATTLMLALRDEFGAPAAMCGTELAPAHSEAVWRQDDMVSWRADATGPAYRIGPLLNIYVLVERERFAEAVTAFVDKYVSPLARNDRWLEAFLRTYVSLAPAPGDHELLRPLMRTREGQSWTVYVGANGLPRATITITEEGDAVLGLGLDTVYRGQDEGESLYTRAILILSGLRDELGASVGMCGRQLGPPHSRIDFTAEAGPSVLIGATGMPYPAR